MISGIILIIALIIIGFAITWSNQGQVKEVELRQSKYAKEKNELAEHDNRSANDVDGTWGQYTIQEGQDNLFLINRRSGKRYKFLLQEID